MTENADFMTDEQKNIERLIEILNEDFLSVIQRLNAENADLKAENADLQYLKSQVEPLQKKLKEYEVAYNKALGANEKLQKLLKERNNRIEEIFGELKALQEKCSDFLQNTEKEQENARKIEQLEKENIRLSAFQKDQECRYIREINDLKAELKLSEDRKTQFEDVLYKQKDLNNWANALRKNTFATLSQIFLYIGVIFIAGVCVLVASDVKEILEKRLPEPVQFIQYQDLNEQENQ